MQKIRHTPADEAHFLVRSTAWTLPAGYQVAAHDHHWPQLVLATRGVIRVQATSGAVVAPPGSAIWIPAGVTHDVRHRAAADVLCLYFNPSCWPALPDQPALIAVTPLVRALIVRATELGMLDDRESAHRAVALLLVEALPAAGSAPVQLPMPRTAALVTVAERLRSAAANAPSVNVLARSAGMSLRTLERRFVAETGLTLGAWRRHAVLLSAAEALAAGVPVKQVADRHGYSTPQAFAAAFQRVFGATPQRYLS